MLGDRDRTALRSALALIAAVALTGCEAELSQRAASAAAVSQVAAAGPVDVAAPEVFQAVEPGLWDGRPSLGGVWVAHPDAQDPERVRIVNRANGQQVIGALFRRERDLPGPALQVSSDAALALGMLAGAPAELEVTALRRREPPEPTPVEEPAARQAAPPEGETPAEAPAEVPAPDAAKADAIARATAAIVAGAAVPPGPAAAAGAIATTSLDAAADASAPGAPLSALRSPFVQLGLFDREANAAAAAQALAGQGLPARVVPSSGGDAWRLLLGPATTEAEQQSLLARAVAAGFEDAYLVRS